MKKKDTKYFQTHSLMRVFLSYFKPHWKLFVLDILCATFIAAVDLAFPLVSRTAMKELLLITTAAMTGETVEEVRSRFHSALV